MRKIEARMVNAVRDLLGNAAHAGTYYRLGNTEVRQSHHGVHGTFGYQRIISVHLHGFEICAIRPDCEQSLWVSDCGWQTVTTKSRLNVLLSCFTAGQGLYQKAFKWFESDGEPWNGSALYSFRPQWDAYQFKQAEAIG
jgi:hypothetical protein